MDTLFITALRQDVIKYGLDNNITPFFTNQFHFFVYHSVILAIMEMYKPFSVLNVHHNVKPVFQIPNAYHALLAYFYLKHNAFPLVLPSWITLLGLVYPLAPKDLLFWRKQRLACRSVENSICPLIN